MLQLLTEKFTLRKSKGFTLIELLVVIAIIGLISALVLVSMGGARTKAKDTAIVNDMIQIRNEAEMYYGSNFNYTSFTPSAVITADITAQGGTSYTLNRSAGSYCAEVDLVSAGWYCVDSSFTSKRYAANPSCSATDFTCD